MSTTLRSVSHSQSNSQYHTDICLTYVTIALLNDFCVLIIRLSVGCLGVRFVIVLCIVHVFGAAHNKETAAADDLQIAADLSINRKAVTTSMMLL